jgi:ATP-dependent phosphofructokinase / diphosphate-dependent phosphofructokinase
MRVKVAVGQFGAPTTVFNSSLFGVLEGLDEKAEVYAILGGASGLIAGQLVPVGEVRSLTWMLDTPGAAFAAGRYPKTPNIVEQAVHILKKVGIDAFVLLGGNGTMSLAAAVAKTAVHMGYPLCVVGVPKTIDNDIVQIYHAPGFPSAARFVLQAVNELQIDLEAMVGFEQVRVVEVMGRRCGWLAAASALLPYIGSADDLRGQTGQKGALGRMGRTDETGQIKVQRDMSRPLDSVEVPRPIICIPEQPLDLSGLLKQIEARVRDNRNALVVVSEGVLDEQGKPVAQPGQPESTSTSIMLGGIGAVIAAHVRAELGFGTRYENLGLLQRCWNGCSLQSDKLHAKRLGQFGASRVLAGQGGVAVGLASSGTDDTRLVETVFSLDELAGQERQLKGDELLLGNDFVRWLSPLIELETMTQYPRFKTERWR